MLSCAGGDNSKYPREKLVMQGINNCVAITATQVQTCVAVIDH